MPWIYINIYQAYDEMLCHGLQFVDEWHSWLIWRVASLHINSDLPCSTDHMMWHAYALPAIPRSVGVAWCAQAYMLPTCI